MTGPAIEHKTTYCRICEPLCGMVATVEDGRLVALRPDRDHPLSAGFACQKGIAFTEIQNDPDRITTPLRRTADGFEPVSWDEALTDIAERLSAIRRSYGPESFAWYYGNPGAFSYSHMLWHAMFVKCLGPGVHQFGAASQDASNRFIANMLLYGMPTAIAIPDVARTDLFVVIGANPAVSHGSLLTAPRLKDRMRDIVKRGGRVLVIDPRRTQTAAQFEWLGIVPDTDAYLLLSLLAVMFEEDLVDWEIVREQAVGLEWLRDRAAPFTPEATQAQTGLDPETVRGLARDLARSPRAAVYGRVGTCVGRSGTLTAFLIDAVNLVAGNLDREGCSMFNPLGMPGERWMMKASAARIRKAYRNTRSRIGNFPSVLGNEPAALMAKEITTPGEGQIKALFVGAGNPVLSVPNSDELEAALDTLQLMVSIDFYLTETNAHCDYVLPATTMYEREDFTVSFQLMQATPFRQATAAVVEPVGDTKPEWEIIDELMHRMRWLTPGFAILGIIRKAFALFGSRLHPQPLVDVMIRFAEGGDRFGVRRRGLSFTKLAVDHPHGVVLAPHLREGKLRDVVVYRGAKVRLAHSEIADEIVKLSCREEPADYPVRMIGMREPRSANSWMHNSPQLRRGGRVQSALIHVDDAARWNVADGDLVRVTSKHGAIKLPAELTKDIVAGVIAIPHGWGHRGTGGWRVANAAGGANVNELTSSAPEDLERLAGMAWLTGVPVRVERVANAASTQPADRAECPGGHSDSGSRH